MSVNDNGEVVSFPYYGGLKGHSLNVHKDGKIKTIVVLNPQYGEGRSSFDTHFNKIQEAAARLVAIQEIAKQKGTFSQEDNKFYADSLFELGMAAQNLAQLQQNGEIKDFSKLLQGSNTQSKPKPSNEIPVKPVNDESNQNGNPFVPVSQDDPYEDFGDSVSINAPKKDASVAEAKPVGLSIAGEGGVASSKPNAVAIAGREGLAVASPKATAIAGVSPEEAAAYSINVPVRNQIVIKNNKPHAIDDILDGEMIYTRVGVNSNRSIQETKSGIAAAVDDYDIVEGIIEGTPSDNVLTRESIPSQSRNIRVNTKGSNVYHGMLGNRVFGYNMHKPHLYVL